MSTVSTPLSGEALLPPILPPADPFFYGWRYVEEKQDTRLILVNHWPFRRDHAVLPRVPRFSIWCGTRATEEWHRRFPIDVVVYGHLHLRSTREQDGVRFEEVSLGYPRQWNRENGLGGYLRLIK